MKTYKKGISLIVLVITVIVLAILATTVIITLSNTNIIQQASRAVFKNDMKNYQEIYEIYLADKMLADRTFKRSELNVTYSSNQAVFTEIFGDNVKDKYKANLQIVNGTLVYKTLNKDEIEMLESIGFAIAVLPISRIEVGDEIEYTPDVGTYSVAAAYTGATDTQSFATETGANALKWRVLHIYDDGSIDIISDVNASEKLSLGGAIGYNNGVDILNDLCKELYSNKSLGAEARSLQLSDLNKKTGYVEKSIEEIQRGTAAGDNRYPAILKDEKGMTINGVTGSRYSKNSKIGNGVRLNTGEYTYTAYENDGIETADSLSVASTYYGYAFADITYSGEKYLLRTDLGKNNAPLDLFKIKDDSSTIWFADRCVTYKTEDASVNYGFFVDESKGNIARASLFYSNESRQSNILEYSYRPVVHISNPIDMTKPGQTVVLQPIASLSVGDVVYYDENGNGVIDAGASGNQEKYIVMYNNDDYGCQIMSLDYKSVVIGNGEKNTNKKDADITNDMRLAAQDAYNNIVLTLNTEATKYLNTTYGLYARAKGCSPVFGTADVQTAVKYHDTTETITIEYPGTADVASTGFLVNVKKGDQGYISDRDLIRDDPTFNKNIMENGIHDKLIANDHLFASRNTSGTYPNLSLRGYNEVLWSYRDNVETVAVCKVGNIYPIITLRGNVTKGTGKGTVEEPYTLVIK